MLQNARVTAFIVSELLRENQQEGGGFPLPPPLRSELIEFKLVISLIM